MKDFILSNVPLYHNPFQYPKSSHKVIFISQTQATQSKYFATIKTFVSHLRNKFVLCMDIKDDSYITEILIHMVELFK